MRCSKIRKLLLDYSDGRLPRERASMVARHLGTCSECARAADDLFQAARLTGIALRPEPSAAFTARVMSRLGEAPAPRRLPRFSWRLALVTAGLVMAILVGWVAGYLHLRPSSSTRPNDLTAFVGFCVSNHSALPDSEGLEGTQDFFMPAAYEGQDNR